MGLFDSIGDFFGGSTPSVSYPSDPGGLSEMTANPLSDAPAFAASSAPSGGNWFSNLFGSSGTGMNLNDVLGLTSKAAGLGSTILGGVGAIQNMNRGAEQNKMALGSERNLNRMGRDVSAASLPLVGAGSSALMGGALPPALEAQAKQLEEQMRARFRDYAVRNGIQDSTQMAQWESYVDQQIQIMRGQLAQNLYSSGLQGVQGAYAPTVATGQIATAAMGGAANQTSNVYSNLFKILGQA